jgi:hypothetical protein
VRIAIALLFLVACAPQSGGYPGPYGDDVPPPDLVDGGSFGVGCEHDSDCGAAICADDHECVTPDQVHRVSVHWTVDGQPASEAACTTSTYLDLTIGGTLTFSPLRCAAGTFTFLRLPVWYTDVTLTAQSTGISSVGAIPAAGGDVTVDLPL